MAGTASGSGTGNRDLFNCPDSASPQTSLRMNTGDVIAKINQQINMLKEGAGKEGGRSDRSEQRESQTVHVYRPDDFFTDEMSAIGSIDFVALSRLKGRSTNMQHPFRHGSQHRGTWAGQTHFTHRTDSNPMHGRGGQNGGYYVYPESGCYPPHHDVHDFPGWHFRGGPRENHWRPCSRGSTTKKGPDFFLESGEAGPVGWVWGPPNPPSKELGVQPVGINRRNLKAKLRKQRRKALKTAAKAQAAQDPGTMVTVEDVADATTERQDVKPKQEATKRKESPTAADKPEFKILKTESTDDNETYNANKMDSAERAAALPASNPGTEGQTSDTRSLTEDTNEKDSVPDFKSAAEEQSCTFFTKADSSTKQQGRPVQTQRKQKYFRKAGMKITAQRIAFVCSVCKFHSFYKKNMAAHLKSKFHKDHFKFLSQHLSEPTVDFLQTYFSNKHKKVEDFIKQIPNHRAAICQLYEDRDLTQDISMEHFIRKEEAAHCLACDVYIPMQHSLIQQHLKSPEHDHNCKIMVVQSKNSGLSIAKHILSHRSVCKKQKHYLKDSMVMDGAEEVRSAGQKAVPNAEADIMKQGAESFYEQVIQAAEPVRDGEDQKAEPFCEQVIQAAEPVRDGEDQKAEPFCEQVIQAAEPVRDGKNQEVEPLSEGVVPAAEAEKNGKEQQVQPVCEGVVPAAEKIRNEDVQAEPEIHDQTYFFDLLNEEEDVEGVELGEEELGEDEYI